MSIRIEDLKSVDFSDVAIRSSRIATTTPGDILLREFMGPLRLSANALARALNVPPNRITGIVNGTRTLTADTALRLAHYFNTSPTLWMNLQQQYELRRAQAALAGELEKLPVLEAA